MENFFNWMTQPVPEEEALVWFNIHNMSFEKIELYGDIFKTLYYIILETYLGDENDETQIELSSEDNLMHFQWCWNELVSLFNKENISINLDGPHRDYFQNFFLDTFHAKTEKNIKVAIPNFIEDVFSLDKPFSKSDLDILTEIYSLLNKNIE